MTDLIELAKKSGFWKEHCNTWMCNTSDLETLSELIRADERKKIAEWYDKSDAGDSWPWFVEEKIRTGGYLND
jgi:hypothetical protein